jgi:tetratricopeptide (TPR) repeat protein
MRGNIKEAFNI